MVQSVFYRLSAKRYLLPEPVTTTLPDLAIPRAGEVVITSPLRKFGELLTSPVIDPSTSRSQLLRIGISSFGADFAGAANFFFFESMLLGTPLSTDLLLKNEKKSFSGFSVDLAWADLMLRVADFFAGIFLTGDTALMFRVADFFRIGVAALMFRVADFFRIGAAAFLGLGCAFLDDLIVVVPHDFFGVSTLGVDCFSFAPHPHELFLAGLAAFVGTETFFTSFFGVDLFPKNEKLPFFWTGFVSVFDATLLLFPCEVLIVKVPNGFFCAGAGVFFGAGVAFFFVAVEVVRLAENGVR